METIKDIVKQFYPVLIMVGSVLFVINVFFPSSEHENVFAEAGELFVPMISDVEIKSDGLYYIDSFVSSYVPVVIYKAGAQMEGSCISWKTQFQVTKEDGSTVRGDAEDGFAIRLLDIKNQNGESVLMRMSADEIAGIEEIPAPFVYEENQDILYCFFSGVYTVSMKVYTENGGQETYEFQLPVESS